MATIEKLERNLELMFIGLIIVMLILSVMIIGLINQRKYIEVLNKRINSNSNSFNESLSSVVGAIKALDRKINDIQTQRYFAWIEKNPAGKEALEEIPECIFDKFGNTLDVYLVGDTQIKFSLNRQYSLVVYNTGKYECIKLENQQIIDCKTLCD